MTPTTRELWTQLSVKWSSLRQKTLEKLFICKKGDTKMHLIYWRDNQQSQVTSISTKSLSENRGNQSCTVTFYPVELNVTPALTIEFLLANVHLSQPPLTSTKVPFQNSDVQRRPSLQSYFQHTPHTLLIYFSFSLLVLFKQTTNFKLLRAKIFLFFCFFLNNPGFQFCWTLSFRHIRSIEKDVTDKTGVLEKSNAVFILFFSHLILSLHISTALFFSSSEIQANPERADGSQSLLEILNASYIFHLNTVLREPLGVIRKSNLWSSDACVL